jgi:hypothetical protein
MRYNATGGNNTAIGYAAYGNSSYTNLSNSTALGYGANVDASNRVRVGNTSVNGIGGQVGWTNYKKGSEMRSAKEDVPGLSFILKLRPVTYYFDLDRIAANNKTPDSLRLRDAEAIAANILQTGFVPEEVDEAASKTGYSFSGVDKNENGIVGLRYSEFTVPLVKAVQELNKKNEEQQAEIEDLKAKLKEYSSLKAEIEALKALLNNR